MEISHGRGVVAKFTNAFRYRDVGSSIG
jgi:hypothetical protein